MTKMSVPILALALMLAAWTTTAQAQEPAPQPPTLVVESSSADSVPLNVQVLLERFQGTKKVSSLPYSLSVSAPAKGRNTTQLRIGAQVPVPTTHFGAAGEGGARPPIASFNYRDIGTSIDCGASVEGTGTGRFLLWLTIEDSWVETGDSTAMTVPGQPSFRSFKASQQVMLRDGQSTQFTSATDKTNGEVVKVTVKLDVVK